MKGECLKVRRTWDYGEVLRYQKERGQYWIYKNKDDKNMIVPRQDAILPWTVNIANPMTWILLGSIVLIIIIGFMLNNIK